MRARPFELAMADGALLRGQSHPSGPDWVLMLHDLGHDLDCWRPIVGSVVEAGFSVASLDLRGHGASDGEADEASVLDDLPSITSRVRSDVSGALILVSSGRVGTAVLSDDFAPKPDAVILFSPSSPGGHPGQLRGEGMPKLFFVGATDEDMDRTARELRNSSLGHAGVVSFPTAEQGTDLLREPWLNHVVEHVIGFARGVVSASSTTTNSTGGRA